jgi:hypothetical protein
MGRGEQSVTAIEPLAGGQVHGLIINRAQRCVAAATYMLTCYVHVDRFTQRCAVTSPVFAACMAALLMTIWVGAGNTSSRV